MPIDAPVMTTTLSVNDPFTRTVYLSSACEYNEPFEAPASAGMHLLCTPPELLLEIGSGSGAVYTNWAAILQ
jgi:hypothetical protein